MNYKDAILKGLQYKDAILKGLQYKEVCKTNVIMLNYRKTN
jgi:hypothetical protein